MAFDTDKVVPVGETWDPHAGDEFSTPIFLPENRTERANAKRLIAQFGRDIRYVPAWKKWIITQENRWAVDDAYYITGLAKKVSDEIWEVVKEELPQADREFQNVLLNFARSSSSARGIDAAEKLARSEPGMAISHSELDANPELLNVLNCTIDLRTGVPREHRREDFITKIAPVQFDVTAQCPTWLRMLDEIFASDESLIGFLRRFFGLCLTGLTTEHVLPFFYGTGANGKSTVVETVLAILGKDYSMRAAPDLLMTKSNDAHPTERADLWGKRFVAASEIEAGRRLNESFCKDLTGGDSIRARRMREDHWEFNPTHKIILVGNHKPNVKGQDYGIWRRLRLVPFNVTIPPEQQDKHLREKLLAEAAGILNWMLAGCLEWQATGLGEPEIIAAATDVYRGEQDVVGQFIAECCSEAPSCKVKLTELRFGYERWCKENGEHPLGGRRFGEALSERGFERYHSGGTWYRGIEIKPEHFA